LSGKWAPLIDKNRKYEKFKSKGKIHDYLVWQKCLALLKIIINKMNVKIENFKIINMV
jgi:hypothetical protein